MTALQVLARIERAGLPQQLIDEGGLAVIDVCDDGDIAKFRVTVKPCGKPPIIELEQARASVSAFDDKRDGKRP
jgi:hypothetical protein